MNNIIFKTTFLKGEDGNSILRIDKTSTSGLVDTYTITLTDGTTTTFNVTNGSSIATIEKTGTVGIVDTYTITLTDGSTSTFEVTNGTVPVDDHLDANSTNPVQNKVVTGAINSANNYDNTTSGLTASTKQGAIDELALDLNGFKFYPTGTNLVALVADDSYYTDSDGNYILADSTTGESLIDNVTYKSLASVEDLRGKVGADTASPFNNSRCIQLLVGTQLTTTYTTYNLLDDLSKYKYILFKTAYSYSGSIPATLNVVDDNNIEIVNKVLTTDYFLNDITELTVGAIMGANENDSVKHILVKKIDNTSVQLKGKTSPYTMISIWGIS
jgi:hypothetical protein